MTEQHSPNRCPSDNLELLLSDRLSQREARNIESHLDGCSECQNQLSRMAATKQTWNDVRQLLVDDGSDLESLVAISSKSGPEQRSGHPAHSTPEEEIEQIRRWLNPSDDPRSLGRIEGYEITGIIGHGGMGIVLKGFDLPLNRYVAIKVLAPRLAMSGLARQRFAREAKAAAAVVHDNVIAIHGVAESAGLPYLVMPYVSGKSLQNRIDQNGPLALAEILRITMQVSSGLAAAHQQGLIHRDIKPANILLDGSTDRVLITDFGLARAADDASITHSGMIAGTPHFMSPEQWIGNGIDQRSDLFSLGSVMYAMATGVPPFRAETSYGILRKVSEDEPRPISQLNADLPLWLDRIVRRLHAKDPAQRYESAARVSELAGKCLAHAQNPAANALPAELIAGKRTHRLQRMAILGLTATAIGCLVLSAVVAMNSDRWWANQDRSPDTDFANHSTNRAVESTWPDATLIELQELSRDLDQMDSYSNELQDP